MPLTFQKEEDYNLLEQGDMLKIYDIHEGMIYGVVKMQVLPSGREINLISSLSARERNILLAGGLLAYTKEKHDE